MTGPHQHTHHHHYVRAVDRAFLLAAAVNFAFIIVEVAAGVMSNSVVLLADAGHNLGDVLGLVVAWIAAVLARRGPTTRFTYGFRGTSILAALFNATVLLLTAGGIAVEAIRRLYEPDAVAGWTVMVVAAVGILVNGATALLFRRGGEKDINVRAVFMHLLGDAVISLGAVLSGAGVLLLAWPALDSLMSLVIAAFLIFSTWNLMRQSVAMALHAVPSDIEPESVRRYLTKVDGVTEIHDLHIWSMSTTERALTCHLVMPLGHPGDRALADLTHELNERFGIHHATLQIETGDPNNLCKLAPDHVI